MLTRREMTLGLLLYGINILLGAATGAYFLVLVGVLGIAYVVDFHRRGRDRQSFGLVVALMVVAPFALLQMLFVLQFLPLD